MLSRGAVASLRLSPFTRGAAIASARVSQFSNGVWLIPVASLRHQVVPWVCGVAVVYFCYWGGISSGARFLQVPSLTAPPKYYYFYFQLRVPEYVRYVIVGCISPLVWSWIVVCGPLRPQTWKESRSELVGHVGNSPLVPPTTSHRQLVYCVALLRFWGWLGPSVWSAAFISRGGCIICYWGGIWPYFSKYLAAPPILLFSNCGGCAILCAVLPFPHPSFLPLGVSSVPGSSLFRYFGLVKCVHHPLVSLLLALPALCVHLPPFLPVPSSLPLLQPLLLAPHIDFPPANSDVPPFLGCPCQSFFPRRVLAFRGCHCAWVMPWYVVLTPWCLGVLVCAHGGLEKNKMWWVVTKIELGAARCISRRCRARDTAFPLINKVCKGCGSKGGRLVCTHTLVFVCSTRIHCCTAPY